MFQVKDKNRTTHDLWGALQLEMKSPYHISFPIQIWSERIPSLTSQGNVDTCQASNLQEQQSNLKDEKLVSNVS